MCFVDILDNLPRLRLSSSQIKMVLWIMRECGARDVPSFKALRATQKRIRDTCGIKTDPHKSDLGNLFYTNDVRDLISSDFANPQVAPYIQKYPEDVAGGPVSEIWQVENGRWHEIPLDELTPSILIGVKRFYIHEIAELADGRWVIPALWISYKGKTHADCHLVTRGNWFLMGQSFLQVSIPAYYEIAQLSLTSQMVDTDSCQAFAKHIPNVCRSIDDGEDLFTVWMPFWADDVSGARSKQYQKHINVYTTNANLPGQLLQQEYFVRFVSTSPNAGALEQLKVVTEQVKSTHVKPVRCYNAETGRPCGVRLNAPDGPADNPQQAEESSHIGHQGNYFCRFCKVGGSKEEKESLEGYHAFYAAGAPRNVDEIKLCVLEQLRLATRGVASHVEVLQTSTGTKDKIAQHWIEILIAKSREMQAADPRQSVDQISEELLVWLGKETDQPYNPLLDLPFFDPSQDTMVEILHTILLGHTKYVWYDLHHNWTPAQQELFTVRLQATNLDGLRVPPIRAAYMMQYRNGLIGKHFKTLMQTMVFHVQDMVSPDQFTLVRALGELGPMLWVGVIENMTTYLEDLEILIDNVLDAFGTLDPSKILIKLKLHVLKHIPENIRRRGPSVRFSTEVFECFNAIFRLCSVLSNHQAPSRDIALKFADLERVKHILSGGFWKQGSEWVSAGKDVRRLLVKTTVLQRHLGWAPKPEWVSGLVKSRPKEKQPILTAQQTLIPGSFTPCSLTLGGSTVWTNGASVTAVSGDICNVGSWGVFRLANNLPAFGRIMAILLPRGEASSATEGVLVVEKFRIGEVLHFHLHMPVLVEERETPRIILSSVSLQFVVNVQHDCRACDCDATGISRQMQERQETEKLIRTIEHKEGSCYVINTHAFHNAALLRKFLPVALTKPRPLFLNRRSRHNELAAQLSAQQQQKRAATKAKVAATKQKKKAEKEAREKAGEVARPPAEHDESEEEDGDGDEDPDMGDVPRRAIKRRRDE
ncbi:hypothetical protein B0H10DRAFT_1929455 [Mycena sp. CBHHK59/15]|nr:hypothetical protein B0H10DRAFT_1929455 [Mycena sp. CBHHK59/15]